MPLDPAALAKALPPEAAGGLQTLHTTLCRREAGAFQRAAKDSADLLVACTQESRLFLELADATEGAPSPAERPIRFVNIRETGGWSKDAATALPKMAALIAAAQLAPPAPVATVSSITACSGRRRKSPRSRLSATVACTSTAANNVSSGVATTSRVPSAVVPMNTILFANAFGSVRPPSTSAAETYGNVRLAPR